MQFLIKAATFFPCKNASKKREEYYCIILIMYTSHEAFYLKLIGVKLTFHKQESNACLLIAKQLQIVGFHGTKSWSYLIYRYISTVRSLSILIH